MSAHPFILQKVAPGDIRRSHDIGRVVQELESLDEGKAWRVDIEEVKSERSLRQNAYLFGVAYKVISEATGVEKTEMHTDFLKMHFGAYLKQVKTLNGWREEEVPVRTTTVDEKGRRSVLGKVAFAEFVDFVKRWAAQGGIYIPDPEPSLVEDEPHQERAA